jgi:hypothetical protein
MVFVLLGGTYTYDLTPASATVTARSNTKVPPWSSVTVQVGALLIFLRNFDLGLPVKLWSTVLSVNVLYVPLLLSRHTLPTLISARRTPYMSDS